MNAAPPGTAVAARPSVFVTVLGWVMIGSGVMGVAGALGQVMMTDMLLPAMLGDLPPDVRPPISAATILRIVGIVSLLSSGYVLYASVALLGRRSWARRFFVGMFALGIVCNLLLLLCLGILMASGGMELLSAAGMPAGIGLLFGWLMNFLFGLTLLATLLLWWLVHRLRSAAVKAEFGEPTVATP